MCRASTSHLEIERYYSIQPQRYPIVERLDIIQGEGHAPEALALSLVIELRSQSREQSVRMILRFWRVTGLELRQPSASEWQLILDVRSVVAMGWERTNYSVIDNDQHSLTFLCERFDFEIMSGKPS